MNPTNDVLEKRVAALEGGAARWRSPPARRPSRSRFSTSPAPVTTSSAPTASTAARTTSSSTRCRASARRSTWWTRPIPRTSAGLSSRNTKAIYAETVGNPSSTRWTSRAVAAIAHEAGVPLIIDNTLATPYLVRPIDHGADIVVHSLTKFIGGHGTSIGGVVVDCGQVRLDAERQVPGPHRAGSRATTASSFTRRSARSPTSSSCASACCATSARRFLPSTRSCFLQGLETLHLRMERHCANAQRVAEHLEGHGKVSWVSYPGLASHPSHELARRYHYRGLYGAIIGFGIKGGREAGAGSSRARGCSRTSPTSAMPSPSSSIRPQRRIRSSTSRSSSWPA